MNHALKKRIINSIELLPYGHDLYLQLARKRLGITYRGVFDSFEGAQSQSERALANEYDVINKQKGEHLEEELPQLESRVLDIDYPLLFWLSRLIEPSDHILELGGSIGQGFYSFEHYFPYPPGIRWTIAELDAAVEAGSRLAHQRHETRLQFVTSANIGSTDRANAFMTAGTLQYMNTSVQDIISQLAGLPDHVIIHNLPAHDSEDFWTLQYLDVCEVPYHIHSLATVVPAIEALGYTLKDQWKNKRLIEIPYHPQHRVDAYFGFYFQKRA